MSTMHLPVYVEVLAMMTQVLISCLNLIAFWWINHLKFYTTPFFVRSMAPVKLHLPRKSKWVEVLWFKYIGTAFFLFTFNWFHYQKFISSDKTAKLLVRIINSLGEAIQYSPILLSMNPKTFDIMQLIMASDVIQQQLIQTGLQKFEIPPVASTFS